MFKIHGRNKHLLRFSFHAGAYICMHLSKLLPSNVNIPFEECEN